MKQNLLGSVKNVLIWWEQCFSFFFFLFFSRKWKLNIRWHFIELNKLFLWRVEHYQPHFLKNVYIYISPGRYNLSWMHKKYVPSFISTQRPVLWISSSASRFSSGKLTAQSSHCFIWTLVQKSLFFCSFTDVAIVKVQPVHSFFFFFFFFLAQHTKEMTATFLYSIHAKLSNDQNLTPCASHWMCIFVWDFIDVRALTHQPVWAGCILSVSLHMDRCHPLFSPLYESAKCFRWTDNLLACSYAQSSLGTSSPTLALAGTLAGFAKQLNARLRRTGRWPGMRQISLFFSPSGEK